MFHSYWSKGNENEEYKFIKNNEIKNENILAIITLINIVLKNGMKILNVSLPKKCDVSKNFKILNFYYIYLFLFVFKIYFSDKNLLLIEKNRKNSEIDNLKYIENLPVLKNDTNNVISFNSGYEETGKNTFKRNFWELFK